MASRKQQKEAARAARLEAEQRAQREELRSKRLKQLGIGLAAVAAVVVVLVLASLGGGSDTGEITGADQVNAQLEGIAQQGTRLGDPKAKVTLIEYGDLQCPACRGYAEEVLPELVAGPVRDGTLKLEFRNWAILGPDSETAARASYAAAQQNRFWQFIELFYRNQGQEGSGYVTPEYLQDVAEASGLDVERFNEDLQSGRYDERLTEVNEDALQRGFSGTPSFVVTGPKGERELAGGVPTASALQEAFAAVS